MAAGVVVRSDNSRCSPSRPPHGSTRPGIAGNDVWRDRTLPTSAIKRHHDRRNRVGIFDNLIYEPQESAHAAVWLPPPLATAVSQDLAADECPEGLL
jgi:hypothetical protein